MINRLVNQRYEVFEKLGEGPLFHSFKARDVVSNRVVTLKSLKMPYAGEERFVENLRTGLEATADLNYPHIARFYEFGMDEGTPYSVREYVRGMDLKDRIRKIAPFNLSLAIDFTCSIAEALNYAHGAGQAHGDLRPQHIIISPEGAVKVLNFGVQRAVASGPTAQREVLKLSAPYHAPELSTAHPGTPAGDIYALGAICYEMLTGTPVYSADSPEALADLHAFAAIPSPRVISTGVPRSVEGILCKCLQKRPEDRYPSAAELVKDLKSVRDALRFGKPLSWTPIDVEKMGAAVERPGATATPVQPVIPVVVRAVAAPRPAAQRTPAPVVVPMEPDRNTMPQNRLRAEDERVSPYLKIAIGTVTVVIIVSLIGLYAIYLSKWALPKAVALPEIVGKSIDDVRKMAGENNVRLIEHGEYNDKRRGIVYRTDLEKGVPIRPEHAVNVWYSRGAEYVDVPNVVGLARDEAEQKLQAAGLKVGRVSPEYSDSVPINSVVTQDVTFKKRVYHDTVVDLIVSDGPKPSFASPSPGDNPPDPGSGDASGNSPDNSSTTPDPSIDTSMPRHFSRTITIAKDGLGSRKVRIEYRDAQGPHPAVVDEQHKERDTIPVKFDYYGSSITMTIYYDDKLVKEVTFDPEKTKRQSVQ